MIYSFSRISTRLGALCAVADSDVIIASYWEDSPPPLMRRISVKECETELCINWLTNIGVYLDGGHLKTDLPFRLIGTEFQKSVWRATYDIPFGQTRTYGEIARLIGKPAAFRAVAQALGANPIGIVVPCHRVVAANGTGGFSGGLNRKYSLLSLELPASVMRELGFHEENH